jgi:hypothetical protein
MYYAMLGSPHVVSSTPRHELTTLVVMGTNCTGKSNYNTITITTVRIKSGGILNLSVFRSNDIIEKKYTQIKLTTTI